jgi:tRNA pseudouridine13 synthase
VRDSPVYLTSDLPGTGGLLKERPEDFLVDELTAYPPSGKGEHIYLTLQKRGLSTLEMVGILARHFGVPPGAIGYAGLKDKNAVTRQAVTVHVPGRKVSDFPRLEHPKIEVLGAAMHANKLRTGHLLGNRFSIRIRGVHPANVLNARAVLERLAREGVPNRVGEQRFGLLGNNDRVGRALIMGEFDAAARELLGPCAEKPQYNVQARRLFMEGRFAEAGRFFPPGARTELEVLHSLAKGLSPKEAFLRLDERVIRFYVSAFQSAVFNSVLNERLRTGTLAKLLPGDIACKHANGAMFAVDESTAKDSAMLDRLKCLEISPSGPMWGVEMMRAAGTTDEAEVGMLEHHGVPLNRLLALDPRNRTTPRGQRRPLRVPLRAPEVESGVDEHGAFIRCAFELPAGAFATEVLREVMKPDDIREFEDEETAEAPAQ